MLTQNTIYAEMEATASSRFRKDIQKKREKGEEHETGYGSRMVSQHLEPLANHIKEWVEHNSTKRGPKHAALKWLKQINPDVAALVALRTVLSTITIGNKKTRCFGDIGTAIEDELRFAELKESEPYLAAAKTAEIRQLVKRKGKAHANLVKLFNKLAIEHSALAVSERVILGGTLFNLLQKSFTVLIGEETVELIRIEKQPDQKTRRLADVITAHPLLSERIESYNDNSEYLRPPFLPMVEQCIPWETPFGGGYALSDIGAKPLRLVKNEMAEYQKEILPAAELDTVVYPTLNAIQDTAWCVNGGVLEVVDDVWESGVGASFGLTSRDPQELPAKPLDIEINEEALAAWKAAAHAVHLSNREQFSARLRVLHIISLAKKFSKSDLFFPHYLDFRGRVYSKPSLLCPQSDDLGKALLKFRNGKPLETEQAADWLAVQGANVWGNDKCRMEERVAFIHANSDEICAVADDPIGTKDYWQQADKPWQFLAFCFEWAGYQREGLSYVCGLPIAMDGSNNGLQILSLLARDEDGGKSTNCIPSETPQDVYTEVANKVIGMLMEDTNKPVGEKLLKKTSNIKSVHDIRDLARYLISMGIDRKTVKRQVMVLPYGGTYRSTMDYTRKWLEECYKVSGKPELDERDLSVYLSRVVWDALNAGLEKPQEVMQWLRDCAAVVVKEGKGLQWETPTGFPVMQRYLKHESKAVSLWTGEKVSKRSKIRIVEPNQNELDTARMRNGVAPNYVHSLDAACLMKTIENMMQFGITNFCVIHDSFGTLPSDVDTMQACIRKAYSDVFSADQLGIFREQILAQLPAEKHGDVPPTPSYGKLDPTKVCESEFFFA